MIDQTLQNLTLIKPYMQSYINEKRKSKLAPGSICSPDLNQPAENSWSPGCVYAQVFDLVCRLLNSSVRLTVQHIYYHPLVTGASTADRRKTCSTNVSTDFA
jgi:hypothetical protein